MNGTKSHGCLSMIEHGFASRAFEGKISGDRHVLQEFTNGVLLAVIDALGHGVDASRAAEIAANELACAPEEPVVQLLKRCHIAMKGSRGAAMSLVSINTKDGTLNWLGIGNVEAIVARETTEGLREREYAPLRGGVVGYQIPPIRSSTLRLQPNDLILFATDGIRSGFADSVRFSNSVQQIADNIMRSYGKSNDDALILVARYKGPKPGE